MTTVKLQDEQWSKIVTFLRKHSNVYVGKEANCRRFMEGVLWIMRSGAQWRFLPSENGNWNSIYKRYARWCDNGVWDGMHEHFAEDPDMESAIIDSTVVRAHPCAAGALKKTEGKRNRPLDVVAAVLVRKSMSTLML